MNWDEIFDDAELEGDARTLVAAAVHCLGAEALPPFGGSTFRAPTRHALAEALMRRRNHHDFGAGALSPVSVILGALVALAEAPSDNRALLELEDWLEWNDFLVDQACEFDNSGAGKHGEPLPTCPQDRCVALAKEFVGANRDRRLEIVQAFAGFVQADAPPSWAHAARLDEPRRHRWEAAHEKMRVEDYVATLRSDGQRTMFGCLPVGREHAVRGSEALKDLITGAEGPGESAASCRAHYSKLRNAVNAMFDREILIRDPAGVYGRLE